MPNSNKKIDTDTICDKLLQEWVDSFPEEKIEIIKIKARNLESAYLKTKEQLDTLTRAKNSLDELTSPLMSVMVSMKSAIATKKNFINSFGDCGITTAHSPEEMEEAVHGFCNELQEYADKVKEAFMGNLTAVSSVLDALNSLCSTYKQIYAIIEIINSQYFKTEQCRRKPIIRDLIRRFQSLADMREQLKQIWLLMPNEAENEVNHKLYANEKNREKDMQFITMLKQLLPNVLTREEVEPILKTIPQAEYTVKTMKKSR